jgi:hypothetical protein
VFVVCLAHSFDEALELVVEEAARPEDFLEWLTLVAWSRTDGSVRCITDFECA